MSPNEERPGLISIERVVAFILGPAVVAGSGWFSAFLAHQLGIHLSTEAIVGTFATGGLGAAGLAYKWLHGRQIEQGVEGSRVIEELKKSPAEGFITTTLQDLEGLAQGVATKTVERLTGAHAPPIPVRPGPLAEADQGAASEL